MPTEWSAEPDWRRVARDLEGQMGYLLRRCLVAEGNDPNDVEAMVALITDVEDVGRL